MACQVYHLHRCFSGLLVRKGIVCQAKFSCLVLWWPKFESHLVHLVSAKITLRGFPRVDKRLIIASRDEKRSQCLSIETDWCTRVRHSSIRDSNRERRRTNADLENKIRERRLPNVSPLGLHQWNKIKRGGKKLLPSSLDLIPLMKP